MNQLEYNEKLLEYVGNPFEGGTIVDENDFEIGIDYTGKLINLSLERAEYLAKSEGIFLNLALWLEAGHGLSVAGSLN